MKSTRLLAVLAIVVTSLVLSCVDGASPTGQSTPATALVGLNAIFPVESAGSQIVDITQIRLTALQASDQAVLEVVVLDVDPAANEWILELELEVPLDDPRILVMAELISSTGGVEWTGIAGPITLNPGQAVNVGQLGIVRGPADNLAVTSVSIAHPGALLEGTGIQLTAEVETDQAGAQPVLRWASADPAIATVTSEGFLQALLPGNARVSTVAGEHDDEITVSVLPRATGLRFVQQPSETDVGRPLDPAPSVEILDARGDRVRTFNEPVTVELQEITGVGVSGEAGGPQAAPDLSGPTTVAAQEGIATFTNLFVDGPGFFRLIATALGLSPATSTDFQMVLLETDIEVRKEADRAVARVGDEVAFTISVTNNGPNEASDVVLFDRLPEGLDLVSVDGSHGGYDSSGGRWDVGTLGLGERATLILVAKVTEGTEGTTLVNTATAEVLIHQNDRSDNNEASAQIEVGTREADIEVLKEVDRTSATRGNELVYTITVINHGPDEALGIVIDEEVPASLDVTSTEADRGSFDEDANQWRVESLAPGEAVQLRVKTKLRDEVSLGDIVTNRVVARTLEGQGDNPDNNEATATVDVQPTTADLQIKKIVDRSSVSLGETVTYTVTVTNHGPDVSTGAEVFELLPLELDVPTFTVSQGEVDDIDVDDGSWRIGRLEPGETATLTAVAHVDSYPLDGQVVNAVIVLPPEDESDPDMGNNVGEASLYVSTPVSPGPGGGGR